MIYFIHNKFTWRGIDEASGKNEMIACCSDGTRPVIFKIERIDVEE
jgi:uncharacterized repeat protein (TIGR04076 family)